jgi:hypothetical protein
MEKQIDFENLSHIWIEEDGKITKMTFDEWFLRMKMLHRQKTKEMIEEEKSE